MTVILCAMKKRSTDKNNLDTILKKAGVLILCFVVCVSLCSCRKPNETGKAGEQNIAITGHLLYGYKHGIKVYGQYLDQAGDDNAMILLFVEKDIVCSTGLQCESVSVNEKQVSTKVVAEELSPQLTAIEVHITSDIVNVDELKRKDSVSMVLEIIDLNSGESIEITDPIFFCGDLVSDNIFK